ncbi:hypothetical protein [Bhargavaea beijingensis]|uniref:Uncharacterized protein n=1 Tax=Bhargavaea beijingensis TaxID=426756 RepID=A0ABX9ZC68_9BACL|nr:hypothetical protein [Bhargavaea beijingensis]RSK30965.1 hypothetical protein EJA12_09620 [Bhargavaea beijingensis]
MRRRNGVPVLLATAHRYKGGGYYMKAWCPMCAGYHTHGGIDQSHRASHCWTDVYKRTGYYLKLDPDDPETAEIVKLYRKEQRARD